MKEVFSVLDEHERRLLRLLALASLLVLAFLFFVCLRERSGYIDLRSELQSKEKVASEAAKARGAGLAPSRQLSGRSGHNIQHPACGSNSPGM